MKTTLSDTEIRSSIGQLVTSPEFAVELANDGKSQEKQVTLEQWSQVAKSLAKLYAVIEAAELLVTLGLSSGLGAGLRSLSYGDHTSIPYKIGNICARLAWQACQPLIGVDKLHHSAMAFTSGNLPPEEVEKDAIRVQATATLLLKKLGLVEDDEV